MSLLLRGGKNVRFFDAPQFSLEWLCFGADTLIIIILKLKLVCPLQHSVCLLILCCTGMQNKDTCASCLCLSGDKMAAMASTRPIRLAPTSLKATVWQHFEFMKFGGRIDKTYTVCKVCGTQLFNTAATQLIWETTLHDSTQILERSSDLLQMPARECDGASSGTASTKFGENKQIIKFIASFIAMDFRPYSGERGFLDNGVHSRTTIQHTISALLYWHGHTDALQWN